MFFDDRLATVLRQRATGEAGLRTQFRQLLDLLGNDRAHAQPRRGDHSLIAAAWLRMDALAEAIPAPERARMIREPGWRFRNPGLAAHLADKEPEVAAAALTRADLVAQDWTALIPRLPVRARGFLRLRRDLPVDVEALLARLGVHDRGLPAPVPVPASADAPVGLKPASLPASNDLTSQSVTRVPLPLPIRNRDDNGRSEISALVERIAQYRKARGDNPIDLEQSPRLPLGELAEKPDRTITSFGFATDTAGRIGWAISEIAPMVIGTRLFAGQSGSQNIDRSDGLGRAFARRQPITGETVNLIGAPAIAGDWIVDAEPRFNVDGHFTGYLGRCQRVANAAARPHGPEAAEADRIRQLLHELRTPVTAVQGYAEVIQQQLFGPAPHEYRALAAAIAADAARILAGFDELDRLARLETGAMQIEPGETDLAALVRRTAAQLEPVLGRQDAGLMVAFPPDRTVLIRLDPDDAEALIWRILASVGAACASGERIAITLDPVIGAGTAAARLVCALPARLAADDNLFVATAHAGESAINSGLFGTGFALRLARAEARAAGGGLQHAGTAIELTLPLLTDIASLPSAVEL